MASREQNLRCPSVQPGSEDSRVFAVVGGTAERPEAAYLEQPQSATEELLALSGPVDPGEVFRFDGPCVGPRCPHFERSTEKCQLATRVATQLPAAVDKLPPCPIRKRCVWWHQEGSAGCLRCPQIVTTHAAPSTEWQAVAWSTSEKARAMANATENS